MATLSPDPREAATARNPETRRRFARLRTLIADERRRRRLLLAGALIALLCVAGLTLLARAYEVLPFDVWFTQGAQSLQWSLVSQLMYAVSWVGYAPWSGVAVGVATLLVGLLLGWRDGLYLLAITAAQGLLNALIKRTIGRPRPLDSVVEVFVPEHGFSFPSGHVMFYSVFFGFLLFLALTRLPGGWLRWLIAVPLALLVLLVGPSRIILGSHWLSDVLAAYLLGFAILALAIEGYLRVLAPATPSLQRGAIAAVDEQREERARS
jgi:membrane-associated phospholipid phosphatase